MSDSLGSDWVSVAFAHVAEASWHAAVVVAVVSLFRRLMGRRLSGGWRCALWGLVAVRLAAPWAPQSGASVFGLVEWMRSPADAGWVAMVREAAPARGVSVTTGFGAPPVDGAAFSARGDARMDGAAGLPWGFRTAAWVWLLGAIVVFGRSAVAGVRFRSRLARVPVADARLLGALDTCRARMGVRRRVMVAESPAVAGPALCGLLRPTILLPPGFAGGRTDEEIEHVLLHELAHAKRLDLWVERVVALLTAVHWFNPLVWAAARRYRADRELARDAMVLDALARDPADDGGARARSYGQTLLRLVESTPLPPAPAAVALGVLSNRDDLTERIAMIARPRGASLAATFCAAVATAVIGCATLTNPPAKQVGPGADDAPAASTRPIEFAVEGNLVTRAYDVRDLITRVEDYDSDAKPATRPTDVAAARAAYAEQLVTLIRDTIDPLTWLEADEYARRQRNGAAPAEAQAFRGAISEFSGQLIVRQTRENHAQVAALLGQLREVRGLQIVTRARFVLFDPAVLAKDDPSFAPLFAASPAAPGEGAKSDLGRATFLTAERTARLIAAIGRQPGAATIASPQLITFNGQRAFVKIEASRAYVADLKPVRDAAGKITKYEAKVDTTESGITLDVLGTASADRKHVTLTVRPRLAKLLAMHEIPFPDTPADHPAGMERPLVQSPEVVRSEVRTTVSVPDGQTLVIGGVADGAGFLDLNDPSVKANPNHRLYVLVTPQLVVSKPK